VFTANNVSIKLGGQIILTGIHSPVTKLWSVNLPTSPVPRIPQLSIPPPVTHQANTTSQYANPAQLIAFAHTALFSPALSTLRTALEKHSLPAFPSLSIRSLQKHPPFSAPMIKGRLDHARKKQRSIQPPVLPVTTAPDDSFPPAATDGRCANMCYVACMQSTGQIFTDQTGCFIIPSSNGNNQLLVAYNYDSNYIHAEPMKSKSGAEILAAYQCVHQIFCNTGLRPQLQRLDSECSALLKEYMTNKGVYFQLAPPHIHRHNAAERVVCTSKNHFIARLCSTDKDFPLYLWDHLLPQAIISLNLLRSSRLNLRLSAWAKVNGAFDFNRTPIAPPGIRVLVHETPSAQSSWSPHAVDGWYVGPAADSYRCYRIWIWETRAERISDTLAWFPKKSHYAPCLLHRHHHGRCQ
jgi:hypothetical protein